MPGIQLDDHRLDAGPMTLGIALGPTTRATATLIETLEYLSSLQDELWQSTHDVHPAPEHGGSAAMVRLRRARQAAAIRGAISVLQELAREQHPPLPNSRPG